MRIIRMSIASVWGWVLLLFGIWIWEQRIALVVSIENIYQIADKHMLDQAIKGLAIFAVGWGYFVFALFVAEKLCPRTPKWMTKLTQSFTAITALGGLGWSVCAVGVIVVH